MEKTDVTNKANNCRNNVAAILFVLLIFWELDNLTNMLYPAYDKVTSKITNKFIRIRGKVEIYGLGSFSGDRHSNLVDTTLTF